MFLGSGDFLNIVMKNINLLNFNKRNFLNFEVKKNIDSGFNLQLTPLSYIMG